MIFWSCIIALVVSCIHPNLANHSAALPVDEARDLLMKTLLTNYHPSSRPGRLNETLMLFVNIELQHFDFRERDGAFHLVGLLHVRWRDPKLVWNPQNYGNMSHITIGQRYIWVPDLEFYNNAPDKFIRMHRNGFVTVKNNGVVFWSDTVDINIFCTTKMSNWPHDRHECHLILGSWTFDGFEVDIMHINANASMSFVTTNKQNMEYKVTEFNASHVAKYYSCCPNPYISLDYNITFERESSYAVIFRIPALAVIGFTLFGLCLEPRRVEMLWLNAISFWIISGELIYFARNSHNFTRETPNIVSFFSASFILVTISQLTAVFSIFVTRSPFKITGRLPHIIDRILNSSWVMRLVPIDRDQKLNPTVYCTSRHQLPETTEDDASNLIDRYPPLAANDWPRFAKLLQRLTCFLIAFTFLILSTVCFI